MIQSIESIAPTRMRLHYLDGLRGWSALYVVYYHIWQFVAGQVDLGPWPREFRITTVLKYGPLAVTIFIVLSGYSLMLPVVRTNELVLAGGMRGFLRRRGLRILPAYYGALACSLLVIWSYPRLQTPTMTQWDIAIPAVTFGNLTVHAVLVHNVFVDWQWKLNPPLWSVALEWQIYFIFALVLLPAWRRFGPSAVVSCALVLGFLPITWGASFAHTWYLASFTFGMCAAAVNFSSDQRLAKVRRIPWRSIGAATSLPVIYWLVVVKGDLNDVARWLPLSATHLAISIGTSAFLIASTFDLSSGRRSRLVAALEHGVSTRLGEFSYSLYLMHYPLVAAMVVSLRILGVHQGRMFSIMALVGAPTIVGICYVFHLLFEKPFLRSWKAAPNQTGKPVEAET